MVPLNPDVFVMNISPENFESCREAHIFGLRVGSSYRAYSNEDIFLVRRTGIEYGVMGIWFFAKDKEIDDMSEVPWTDSEYRIKLWFDPFVDFQTPMSEEFSGTSKYSQKIQITAMRIAGSLVRLGPLEITKYLESILKEKAKECSTEIVYQNKAVKLSQILNDILARHTEKAKAEVLPLMRVERGVPAGEPINFRDIMYAPLNEAGVILLFSKVMRDLGIVYESSPIKDFDMVGRVRTNKGLEQKHFEFEFQSYNFKIHNHDPSLVDYIVCWEHNWPECPKDIAVIELREVIKNLPAQFPSD